MSQKDIRTDYAALSPKNIKTVAQLLAVEGRSFDDLLHDMVLRTRTMLKDLPEFAIWMAEALAWARFAKRDETFFTAASRFLITGGANALDTAASYPDRFGAERLRDALLAFRHWFQEMSTALSSIRPDALKMKALQERSLLVAQRLKTEGQFHQIGMWLFPAPFKIMVVAHRELWTDPNVTSVLMPAGTQVERALRQLVADNVISLEEDILQGGDGTFADNATSLWALQLSQQELAKAGGTSVPHINSALHSLGYRGDLK